MTGKFFYTPNQPLFPNSNIHRINGLAMNYEYNELLENSNTTKILNMTGKF